MDDLVDENRVYFQLSSLSNLFETNWRCKMDRVCRTDCFFLYLRLNFFKIGLGKLIKLHFMPFSIFLSLFA